MTIAQGRNRQTTHSSERNPLVRRSLLVFSNDILKKVKWSRYRPGVTQTVGRGIALLFHHRGTRRGWVVSSMPRPHFTPGKDPVPIVQEAGWVPGPVWTGGKTFVPTGIRSRTVHPLVGRYTDWANRPTVMTYKSGKCMNEYIVHSSHYTKYLYAEYVSHKKKQCVGEGVPGLWLKWLFEKDLGVSHFWWEMY